MHLIRSEMEQYGGYPWFPGTTILFLHYTSDVSKILSFNIKGHDFRAIRRLECIRNGP